ncbi:MAG: AAA family ATPase [Cyclobacteriaceae bacterium]
MEQLEKAQYLPAGNDDSLQKLDAVVKRIKAGTKAGLRGLLVTGAAGIGKTYCIENYLAQFEQSNPVIIARHHIHYEAIPYYGFKQGLADYFRKVYNNIDKHAKQEFSQKLKEKLGVGFPLLLEYLPELELFSEVYAVPAPKMGLKVENQIFSLFNSLFDFLSAHYGPVYFFTDDFQWMDDPGVNLLSYLLLNMPKEKFIWIGACREPYIKINNFRLLQEDLGLDKNRIEIFKMKGMSHLTLKNYVESHLGLTCHKELLDVLNQLSGGNPAYVLSLIENLKSNQSIWLQSGMWYCNQKAIADVYKGQTKGQLLMQRLKMLNSQTKEMLELIACMGRFSKQTLTDWLQGNGVQLEQLALEAAEAGFLERRKKQFRFTEIHIGEMIYDELSNEKRSNHHYTIAQLLQNRGLPNLSATQFLLMVTQYNQALNRVRQANNVQACAELNYMAGKYAKQDNALKRARIFFKTGADLLKEANVFDNPTKVFNIYMELAEVEYLLGEYDLAEMHLDYLLQLLHDFDNRITVFEFKITINNHLGRYRKAVRILAEALKTSGLELPIDEDLLGERVQQLKSFLENQSEVQEQYQSERDGRKHSKHNAAILRLLYVGGIALHHTSDVLMVWAALEIVTRSQRHTYSSISAIGFVSYGRMCMNNGDIEIGYKYGRKGLDINHQLDDIGLRCRVFGVYAFYIHPWRHALSESLAYLENGIEAGKKSGDLIGVYILKTHMLNCLFLAGKPLREILALEFSSSYPGTELTYYITNYQQNLISYLVGDNPVFSIPGQQPSWLAARFTFQEERFYRNHVWARYYLMFGYYELAERSASAAHENSKLQEGSPLFPANLVLWFISITQNWLNYDKEEIAINENRLVQMLDQMDIWKTFSPQNFDKVWWLLKAEHFRIQGQHDQADECFRASLEDTSTAIHYRALAAELYLRFLLARPNQQHAASKYLQLAIELYKEWGAMVKAKQLSQQYQFILASVRDTLPAFSIDIETIQHELSGDLEVASLVKKLMILLLRISGSTKVAIGLVNENNELKHSAEAVLVNGRLRYIHGRPLSIVGGVPFSLINMAHRSQKSLVEHDLQSNKGLPDTATSRKNGVQSFMILPVTINGLASMVIYLENTFVKKWYEKERIKWVRITANQGAVIIENARIHQQAINLNGELLKQMKERDRLTSIIEAQKDAHMEAIIKTQDDERKRIARDLHDSLGSLLSSVKLRFNSLQDDFNEKIPAKASRFKDTLGLLDESVQELRRIAHNMLPVSLSRFGLNAALQTFIDQINDSEKLEIELKILGLERRLSENLEVAIYRICQELVQNVINHSKASHMNLQLVDHGDTLNLTVEDNGIGMDKEKVLFGFGFTTIQSKVSFFKGSFEIESQPGKGTLIVVDLPLEKL